MKGEMMKRGLKVGRKLFLIVAAVLSPLIIIAGVTPARKISVGEVRDLLRHLGGADFGSEQVRIRRISSGLAGDVVVEAQIETAWRLVNEKDQWRIAEVRLGDRHWESLELVEEAVRREKIRRTLGILREMSGALDGYHRDRAAFVVTNRVSELLDAISPRYLSTPYRVDLWGNQLDYRGSVDRYQLRSAGPDGRFGSADDLLTEGRLPGGRE